MRVVQVRYEGTQAVEVQKFANGQLLGMSIFLWDLKFCEPPKILAYIYL